MGDRSGSDGVAVSSVIIKDNGAAALLKNARALRDGARVRVGILADAPKREAHRQKKAKRSGSVGRMSLVEIAALHEFGAPGAGIPQRSFIRATVDSHREEIDALQKALALKILKSEIDHAAALELLGAKVAAMVQARIAEGIAPALKPETIRRKKSSKPLVDTGQLKSAVTWKAA